MKWPSAAGDVSYNGWTAQQKADLGEVYWRTVRKKPIAAADPPPNLVALLDTDYPRTVLTEADAWTLYLTGVARCLHVDRSGLVSWKLEAFGDVDLERLLSAAWLKRSTSPPGMEIRDLGYALPSPAPVVASFVSANGFVDVDRRLTLGKVLEWCRQNLRHFTGAMEAKNAEGHWQYRGLPPVSRIIAGTTRTDGTSGHFTGGCHGTNGFLISVLRSINIPAVYQRPQWVGHATPWFPADDLFLSHGDDPYNRFAFATPPYPATELLVDRATYDSWFVPPDPTDPSHNVGRQVYELALVHLPDELLRDYCADLGAGTPPATSRVAAHFSRWYTVVELQALGLWNSLAAKVASFGGCANIP